MNKTTKFLLIAIVIGVLINLIVPFLLFPFATPEQVSPPKGAENLPLFDQLIHMFVHHAQVPFTSSIIIAVIVGGSVSLAQVFC